MEIGPEDGRMRQVSTTASEKLLIKKLGDDVESALLFSIVEEICGLVERREGSVPESLAEVFDAYCLPLLGEPEVLGALAMLLGQAAVRQSRLSVEVANCRKRALLYVTGHVALAQQRGAIPANASAESITRIAGTVLTGLCLTAVAEGRRPTLEEYCAVRDFLVSAYA